MFYKNSNFFFTMMAFETAINSVVLRKKKKNQSIHSIIFVARPFVARSSSSLVFILYYSCFTSSRLLFTTVILYPWQVLPSDAFLKFRIKKKNSPTCLLARGRIYYASRTRFNNTHAHTHTLTRTHAHVYFFLFTGPVGRSWIILACGKVDSRLLCSRRIFAGVCVCVCTF